MMQVVFKQKACGRGRATDMLARPDAFKARARARAAYTADVAAGRPVVAAARETEAMVAELLRWAAQMPPFAPEITGTLPRTACPAALPHQCHVSLVPGMQGLLFRMGALPYAGRLCRGHSDGRRTTNHRSCPV